MDWKVPMSSTIYEAFGEDHLARDLFIHLLLKARNSDMIVPDYYHGKPYLLMKGQLIFGRRTYATKLRSKPTTVHDALRRLTNRQDDHQIKIEPSYNFTIVTVIFYGELVKMTRSKTSTVTSKQPALLRASDTNKNAKNEKNTRKDIDELKEILRGKVKEEDGCLYRQGRDKWEKIANPSKYLEAVKASIPKVVSLKVRTAQEALLEANK